MWLVMRLSKDALVAGKYVRNQHLTITAQAAYPTASPCLLSSFPARVNIFVPATIMMPQLDTDYLYHVEYRITRLKPTYLFVIVLKKK